jgi:hypothetical protein
MSLLRFPEPYDFELSMGRFRVFGTDLVNRFEDGVLYRAVTGRDPGAHHGVARPRSVDRGMVSRSVTSPTRKRGRRDLALRKAAVDLYGVDVHELGPRLDPFQNLSAHYLLMGWLTKP